jgi:RimJ/RimL family protein N-acetyltransferase
MIQTNRLLLRPWRADDGRAFAQLHADPTVMADLGGPMDRLASDRKLDRYRTAYLEHGVSRWAVEDAEGNFVGYAGVMPRPAADHPLGPHHEIGWRFVRSVWGRGYATESAQAALKDAFEHRELQEILSYTSADNLRSQAVMARLRLQRDESRDFVADYGRGPWRGLVWVARAS